MRSQEAAKGSWEEGITQKEEEEVEREGEEEEGEEEGGKHGGRKREGGGIGEGRG